MPRRDGTGPINEGPLTGKGLGACENTENLASNTINQSTAKTAMGLGRGRNCSGGQKNGHRGVHGHGNGCGKKSNRRFGRNMDNQ